MDAPVPFSLDPITPGFDIHFDVEVYPKDGMLREARVVHGGKREFVFASDEGDYLGGQGRAPMPLAYFSAAIGF